MRERPFLLRSVKGTVPPMQARRERITFALALFMAGAGAMSGIYMGFALWLLAVFFFLWGRHPASVEGLVARLPAGAHLTKAIGHLDSILAMGLYERQKSQDALGAVLSNATALATRPVKSHEDVERLAHDFQLFCSAWKVELTPHISVAEMAVLFSKVPASAMGRAGVVNDKHNGILYALEVITERLHHLMDAYSS